VLSEITVPLSRPRRLAGALSPEAAAIEARMLDLLLNPTTT
jgi:hypothetical protein